MKLVLTQPDPVRLAGQLQQAGYECTSLPMLAIVASNLDAARLTREIDLAQAVVVVSPAAAQQVRRLLPAPPGNKLWLCPGHGTAQLLRTLGLHASYPQTAQNARAMLDVLRQPLPQLLVWLGGQSMDATSASWLDARGIDWKFLHCYTASPLGYGCRQLAPHAGKVWLISSLAALCQSHRLWQNCALHPRLLVTSQRLQEACNVMGYTCLVAASNQPQHILHSLNHSAI